MPHPFPLRLLSPILPRVTFIVGVLAVPLASSVTGAEVKVVSDRNGGSGASAAFKFEKVPSPSANDAATNARFSIFAGEPDPNGADAEALKDGRLPEDDDRPDANFFFDAGTPGGRIVVDLGEATEVLRVNTYSWHRSTRGPQVYRLYGSDGEAAGFEARPAKSADPETRGWKAIASVDTRPKEGPAGGQYGVSISTTDGSPLVRCRYLLFEIERTEDADPFGNTFLSEIDVDDGKEHARDPAEAKGENEYEILIDFSEMPELEDWVEKKLRPTLKKWYPIIIEALPSEGYEAPRRLTVTFRKDMRGVAATSGRRVSCAGEWFRRNLDGEAVGAVVHELVHVAQGYRSRRNPGWLVEGVADWIRWFQYEPKSLRPRPNPDRAKYTDSYRTTAAFLHYLTETHDKDLVKKLNVAMREGKYSPELWNEYLGKTVDELWAEYVETLKKGGPPGFDPELLVELRSSPYKILHETNRDGNWELYVVNADGTDPVNLTRTSEVDELYPKASPDGSRIAFVADTGEGDAKTRDLYWMRRDGSGRTRVSENAREPCWSADGSSIAFLKGELAKFTYTDFATKGIFIHDPQTGETREHPNAEILHLYALNWSPDGKWFVATVHGGMGFAHSILALEADGNGVFDLKLGGCRPDLSPDGKRIAWGNGDFAIGVADLDLDAAPPRARGVRNAVESADPLETYHADWSPDGKYVCYSFGPKKKGKDLRGLVPELPGSVAPGWNICVAEAGGRSRWVALTTDGTSCKEPDWLPPQKVDGPR